MRNRLSLIAVLLASLTGCKSPCCDSSACAPPARSCPAPEVAQETQEIEVKAPRQKIVVEMPSPTVCKAPAPAAAPCQTPAMQPGYPGGYPQQMMPQATTTYTERTGFGFMFDTMRIPIPILRPMAIPRPAEMTTTMPMAPAMSMMPMMPMPMMAAAQPTMPMMAAAQPTMPMMAAAQPVMPMMAQPAMAMVPQQPAANASMNLQGSMSTQSALAMLAAANNLTPQQLSLLVQMSGQAQGGNQNGFAMQLGAQLTPEQIERLRALLNQQPPPPPPPPVSSNQPNARSFPDPSNQVTSRGFSDSSNQVSSRGFSDSSSFRGSAR